jgi:hypothetical protein
LATFTDHLKKAESNLVFLAEANQLPGQHWDWQVTVAFYVAVHLINAHIVQKSGLNYRSHEQVGMALNPNKLLSTTKLSESDYLAYSKLQGLARRARYLCHDDTGNRSPDAHFTYDKHFARAIRHLDTLLTFMRNEYSVNVPRLAVRCVELNRTTLVNIDVLT